MLPDGSRGVKAGICRRAFLVQDKNLHLPGRAELPLCPELLGGAAAPPYRRHEDSSHVSPLSLRGGKGRFKAIKIT